MIDNVIFTGRDKNVEALYIEHDGKRMNIGNYNYSYKIPPDMYVLYGFSEETYEFFRDNRLKLFSNHSAYNDYLVIRTISGKEDRFLIIGMHFSSLKDPIAKTIEIEATESPTSDVDNYATIKIFSR